MFNRILVPLDGTPQSAKALVYARGMAHTHGSELVLLRVIEMSTVATILGSATMAEIPSAAASKMLVKSAENSVADDRRRAGRYLKRHERAIQGQGIDVSTEVAVGDPARVIRNVARQRKVDLIVVATRARGRIQRALLGSVADELVRRTRVPVLLIRR